MLITCPSCATAYRIELPSLGAGGRLVRCARCRTMWLATAESAVPAPHDLAHNLDARAASQDASRPQADEAPDAAVDFGLGAWSTQEATDGEPPSGDGASDVPIADAPPLVPSQDATSFAGHRQSATPVGDDIETIAARRAQAAPRSNRLQLKLSRPGLPVLILMLVAMLAALVNWRSAVVRLLPQTASLFAAVGLSVNLRGLSFENLKTTQEFHDGMAVLVVEGTIVNSTKNAVEVPRLRFALRNSLGQEVYAWTALPARSILPPDESLAFRTRLASPPSDGRDVVVRFFTRHDLIVGMR